MVLHLLIYVIQWLWHVILMRETPVGVILFKLMFRYLEQMFLKGLLFIEDPQSVGIIYLKKFTMPPPVNVSSQGPTLPMFTIHFLFTCFTCFYTGPYEKLLGDYVTQWKYINK